MPHAEQTGVIPSRARSDVFRVTFDDGSQARYRIEPMSHLPAALREARRWLVWKSLPNGSESATEPPRPKKPRRKAVT